MQRYDLPPSTRWSLLSRSPLGGACRSTSSPAPRHQARHAAGTLTAGTVAVHALPAPVPRRQPPVSASAGRVPPWRVQPHSGAGRRPSAGPGPPVGEEASRRRPGRSRRTCQGRRDVEHRGAGASRPPTMNCADPRKAERGSGRVRVVGEREGRWRSGVTNADAGQDGPHRHHDPLDVAGPHQRATQQQRAADQPSPPARRGAGAPVPRGVTTPTAQLARPDQTQRVDAEQQAERLRADAVLGWKTNAAWEM